MRAARQADVEAEAAAIEAGRKPPAPTHEAEAREQLDGLRRSAAAAGLVRAGC